MNVTFIALSTLLSFTNGGDSLWRVNNIATVCEGGLDTRQPHETDNGYASRHIGYLKDVCNTRFPTYGLAAKFYEAATNGQTDRATMLMPVMVPPGTENPVNFGLISLVRCPLWLLYTPLALRELDCRE
jgi:hypothetical protein